MPREQNRGNSNAGGSSAGSTTKPAPHQPGTPNRPNQPRNPSQPVATKPNQPSRPDQPTKPNQPVANRRGNNGGERRVGVDPTRKPTTNTQTRVEKPREVVKHERLSHYDNKTTVTNINVAKQNVVRVRNDTKIVNIVNVSSTRIVNNYNTTVVNRTTVINNYYGNPYYRNYYNAYWRYGFVGGYYYPVHPCYDIQSYLYYPVVYWLYADSYDDYYWSRWYGADVRVYPVRPFPFGRVYYPTVVFRDLAIEVSAMPTARQYYFRTALTNLTQALVQQLANNLGVELTLNQNEIVVNHYENLGNQAIVMEGSVDLDRDAQGVHVHAPFKALLDLNDPNQTLVFVPVDQAPTQADLYTLNVMNNRIRALGGNPFRVDEEPAVIPAY